MRVAGALLVSVLSAAVIAEGAYLLKMRRQVDALSAEVRELASEGERAQGPPRPGVAESHDGDGTPWATAVRRERPGLPVPRFLPATNPAGVGLARMPVPSTFEAPEAREQLRQIVSAEIARERQERREGERKRWMEQQERRTNEAVEAVVKGLGLGSDDAAKFKDLVASTQAARHGLREKIESGQLTRQDIGREATALRQQAEGQLVQLLGEERAKKAREIVGWGGRDRGRRDGEGGRERPRPDGQRVPPPPPAAPAAPL